MKSLLIPLMDTDGRAIRSYFARQRGFTIAEMAVVLVILAVLLAMAIPSIREYVLDARVSTQGTELVSDLAFARSEAANQGRRVVVCASTDNSTCSGSGDDWARGRIIFLDANSDGARQNGETLLRIGTPVSSDSTIVSAFNEINSYVGFMPYGGLYAGGGRGTFKICIPDFNRGRLVTLEMSGRATVRREPC